MALSLSAEQRNILQIFSGEELFFIPDYQRSYSWGYDECYLLYNDLMTAFKDDQREYFIGNIVLARYATPKYERQVVDGQQRLTTIWIILKVLSVLCESINPLHDALSVKAREGGGANIKIQSRNNEDKADLDAVFSYDSISLKTNVAKRLQGDGTLTFNESEGAIIQATLNFYNWFSYFSNKPNSLNLKDFANYLLDNVYLLPIELYDSKRIDAENKALIIFETINNRGKDLNNADIFKSRLYDRALFAHEQDKFTQYWKDFIQQCHQLDIEVDEIFRFYSHVIRGLEGKTQMEVKLRDFFVGPKDSPLVAKPYNEVMEDLFKILDVLRFIREQKHTEISECGKWFQIIDAYSNNYPLTAVVVFLFINGVEDEQIIVEFTKSVIRYAYSYGSSRSVKFGIYNIIATAAKKLPVDLYIQSDFEKYDFASAGRIKEGFAMIAYYQDNPIIPNISIDKWINSKDYSNLSNEWKDGENEKMLDSIGNYIVLDVARMSAPLSNRTLKYRDGKSADIQWLMHLGQDTSIDNFKKRDKIKRESVGRFFSNK